MIISKPFIETRGNDTFLISHITDEVSNVEKDIFYSVPNEYGKYLSNEVADAFVVAMLLPALVSGQNIKVNAPISEILYYQIENNLIYTLSKVFVKKTIKVFPQSTFTPRYNPTSVATGFSGGIDSFTTVLQHIHDVTNEFKLSHLTLFNVGSYGNDYNKTLLNFKNDINRAKEFSVTMNLPLITIDSNLNDFYNQKTEKIFNFSPRSTMCLISGVLALQKLFKHYFIASSGTIESIQLNKHDQYYYEWLISSFLSNTNTSIFIANGDLNRVEKTKYVAKNKIVREMLFVCAADIYNEKHGTNFKKDTSPNCSECLKCKRTLITLDLLGELDNFSTRFDIEKYKTYKDSLFVNVIANHEKDHFLQEIYDLMIEINYQIHLKYKLKVTAYRFKNKLLQLKLIRKTYRYIFNKNATIS